MVLRDVAERQAGMMIEMMDSFFKMGMNMLELPTKTFQQSRETMDPTLRSLFKEMLELIPEDKRGELEARLNRLSSFC